MDRFFGVIRVFPASESEGENAHSSVASRKRQGVHIQGTHQSMSNPSSPKSSSRSMQDVTNKRLPTSVDRGAAKESLAFQPPIASKTFKRRFLNLS